MQDEAPACRPTPFRRRWSREFRRHAVCLRNNVHLQVHLPCKCSAKPLLHLSPARRSRRSRPPNGNAHWPSSAHRISTRSRLYSCCPPSRVSNAKRRHCAAVLLAPRGALDEKPRGFSMPHHRCGNHAMRTKPGAPSLPPLSPNAACTICRIPAMTRRSCKYFFAFSFR
jgi:hypothetical protein